MNIIGSSIHPTILAKGRQDGYPSNAFSSSTVAARGLIPHYAGSYVFLRAIPGGTSNIKDPVSRLNMESWSADFRKKQKEAINEIYKTKQQIRFNNFSTNTGTSRPGWTGTNFTTDYDNIRRKTDYTRYLMYGLAAFILYKIIT